MLVIKDTRCGITKDMWGHSVDFDFVMQDNQHKTSTLLKVQELYITGRMKDMFQYIADNMENQ